VRRRTSQYQAETNGIVADFLVDTDVFIDHLRGARRFDSKSHRVHYSVVTRAELFAGSTATDLIRILLAPFRELEVGRVVAERAGRLRRETGIRLPDALIAATAIEHKLSLFTRNRADFEKVPGLRVREIG
jgi:toxin FitB